MDQLMERNNMPKISYIRTYITGTSTGTEPVYRIDSFLPNSCFGAFNGTTYVYATVAIFLCFPPERE